MTDSWWGQPLHKDYVPLNPKQLVVIILALFLVDGMGIIDVPVIDTQSTLEAIFGREAVSDFITDVTTPVSPEENAVPVYVNVYCYEGLDVNTAGMAGAASDQIVRVYNADRQLLEQATTSSGVIKLTRMYLSGSTLYLQARHADVATCDPYMSPVVARTVFHSDSLGWCSDN
jgi:hypothetical protein